MLNFEVDLINGKIYKSLMIFAIPILVSNVFQQLYNTVDTIIVGNYLGNQSLAAIGAASVIYELLVGFAIGVGAGLSIVVARNFGMNNEERFKQTIASATIISASLSVILIIVSQFLLMPFLTALNTPPEIINEAYQYISVLTLFGVAMIAFNFLSGILRAVGNSFIPLIFLIISSFMNIGLDILFITRFNSGIAGAAVATVMSQAFTVILCLIYIKLKYPILIPAKRHFQISRAIYHDLLTQGLSMGMMMALVTTGTVILQSSINGLGYLYVAAHTAARRIGGFFMMPLATLGLALSTFVSQNKGADRGHRIRQAVAQINMTNIAISFGSTIILFFFAKPLVTFISGSTDPVVLQNASNYLMFNAPFYAVVGVLFNMRNSLQALNIKVLPLISSIVELIGKIIFTFLLVPKIGYWGIIICEPIIWCFMCAQLVYTFYRTPYIVKYKPKPSLNA